MLDIAIVSFLIYEFLKLIRGTRAVQMAVGSLLIVGLFYVSRLAPLQTVNWMIRNTLRLRGVCGDRHLPVRHPAGARAFGRAPFFRYFNRQEATNETIEEVVVAATMLASQQTGAIIAIEREIGLRNYIESGIPLDAEMTYDLLVTIFQPGSPLHDGAVILQENRIAAAACFLPLTVNPVVSRELGTRHRAAIGLTEENDAVAVVVSEETGQIALAHRRPDRARPDPRSVARAAADADLAAPVTQSAAPATAVLRPLMAYHPFRHLGLKVLAITLASVLWFTVAGEHVVERSLRVPLAVRNLPTHLEIVGDLPDSVDVRVRGSSAQLSRLDPGDVVAMLDLSSDRTGAAPVPPARRRSARAVPASRSRRSCRRRFRYRSRNRTPAKRLPIVPEIKGDHRRSPGRWARFAGGGFLDDTRRSTAASPARRRCPLHARPRALARGKQPRASARVFSRASQRRVTDVSGLSCAADPRIRTSTCSSRWPKISERR